MFLHTYKENIGHLEITNINFILVRNEIETSWPAVNSYKKIGNNKRITHLTEIM